MVSNHSFPNLGDKGISDAILRNCRNHFEVTEEFVQQYNAAEGFDEQARYEDVARKMLARIKVNRWH